MEVEYAFLERLAVTMEHSRVFLTNRQRMSRIGVGLYEKDLGDLRELLSKEQARRLAEQAAKPALLQSVPFEAQTYHEKLPDIFRQDGTIDLFGATNRASQQTHTQTPATEIVSKASKIALERFSERLSALVPVKAKDRLVAIKTALLKRLPLGKLMS